MQYDVILVIGELFFDHPMSGPGLLKRLLEKQNYTVGIIEQPQTNNDVTKLGEPKLFFGVSSGAIDSMVRNYTPLKKQRTQDEYNDYDEKVKDRAVIVYSNWIKQHYKNTPIILGGTEASLRRFTHYDYWDNNLRKPILFDSKADLLVFGNGEKQIIEIAHKIKNKKPLTQIKGTCEIVKEKPKTATTLPSHEDVMRNKDKFIELHNLINNDSELIQKIDTRYCLQNPSPEYTTKDLDEYYELPFTRELPKKLRGFEFSVVTHRGCIGNCNFCALNLIQGNKIISRSEESILNEIKKLTKYSHFKGNIDDLTGPSTNMYGMDCEKRTKCKKNCVDCDSLKKDNKKLIQLLKKARTINGIKHIYVRSGIRFDLATKEYVEELIVGKHIYDFLRIAPEHVDEKILKLMNKNKGNLTEFINLTKKTNTKLSYYFMTAHPGSTMKEAKKLSEFTKKINCKEIQVFTPTPMTTSTCMYYTSTNPETKEKIHVPHTYKEKKEQKRLILNQNI